MEFQPSVDGQSPACMAKKSRILLHWNDDTGQTLKSRASSTLTNWSPSLWFFLFFSFFFQLFLLFSSFLLGCSLLIISLNEFLAYTDQALTTASFFKGTTVNVAPAQIDITIRATEGSRCGGHFFNLRPQPFFKRNACTIKATACQGRRLCSERFSLRSRSNEVTFGDLVNKTLELVDPPNFAKFGTCFQ